MTLFCSPLHLCDPKEQKTQQSSAYGLITLLHDLQRCKITQWSLGICSSETCSQSGQVSTEKVVLMNFSLPEWKNTRESRWLWWVYVSLGFLWVFRLNQCIPELWGFYKKVGVFDLRICLVGVIVLFFMDDLPDDLFRKHCQ